MSKIQGVIAAAKLLRQRQSEYLSQKSAERGAAVGAAAAALDDALAAYEPSDEVYEITSRLKELGYRATIWSPEDFPGSTPEEKRQNFDANIKYVLDISTERGFIAIENLCGSEEDEEEEEGDS